MRTRPRYGRIAALCGAATTSLVTVLGGMGGLPTGRAPHPPADRGVAALAADVQRPDPSVRPSEDQGRTGTDLSGGSAASGTTAGSGVPALPEDSGEGRRVVFDQSSQRVWLVGRGEVVRRSYLVSGSIYDNLDPGTYAVYSRSTTAIGVDGSHLRYMVRFAYGFQDPIGFHAIPLMNGEAMQTRAELGTPLSHGCIRQALPDAKALWRFTPVGTPVVVTA